MKTLVADTFPESHLHRLRQIGCEVDYKPSAKAEDLPALAESCKILMVRSKKVTGETLQASRNLALVLRAGAGVNTIDVKSASSRGIFVSNCPGKNSIAVAELVFALLLSLDRRIPEGVAALREGKWNKKEFSRADGIFGKTLGVIGVGSIGREVIRRAHGFGLRVVAWSRSLTAEEAGELGAQWRENMDDIFRESDIVTLHVALTPDTRKLVNAARLWLMKPGAILINTARGEVVDQTALREALETKRIRACLDVFDPEPAAAVAAFNDPILKLPNLYGSHHIGASTEQAQNAIADEAIRVIETFIKTGVVVNCVNLARRTPARWQLVVRHHDRMGVLAFVTDHIRRAGLNIEEVQNVVFDGALAASCRIQLGGEPPESLLSTIQEGNNDIIGLDLLQISDLK
jgi:D-3-phosphoglycerate dehydrogenase